MELTMEDVLKRVYRYALSHCYEKCPEHRDPLTCVLMFKLGKRLNMLPPCMDIYGDFSEKVFRQIIADIEKRYGKKIEDVISDLNRRKPKSLQEMSDKLEGEFAVEVLRVLRELKGET